ncbi:phiSA1p31-related protein [Streptomyces sioyaensis]|uniref:phiSA1p31-related protein n=1 Tax=Streptomyces sioyaensis TaxID=67364 RepID=UPI0036B00073
MAEQTFKIGDEATYGDKAVTISGGPHVGYSKWYVALGADGKEFPASADLLTLVPAFAIGDEVTYEYGGGGKLIAGPFKSGYHDTPFWVLEKPDGTHMTPTQNSLTKVVKPEPDTIKVGDRVRVVEDGANHADVKRGDEFTVTQAHERFGPLTIVVDDGAGGHWYFRPEDVEKVADRSPNMFTHNGVTYDLSADYRDRDGDLWSFARVGDEVRGEFGTGYRRDFINGYSDTLESAVRRYGPLTRV